MDAPVDCVVRAFNRQRRSRIVACTAHSAYDPLVLAVIHMAVVVDETIVAVAVVVVVNIIDIIIVVDIVIVVLFLAH